MYPGEKQPFGVASERIVGMELQRLPHELVEPFGLGRRISAERDRSHRSLSENIEGEAIPGIESQSLFAGFIEFWVLHRVCGVQGIVKDASTALQRQVLCAEIAGA